MSNPTLHRKARRHPEETPHEQVGSDVFDHLHSDEVRRQVGHARNEYGEEFDAAPLTMILLLHRVAAALRSAESYELESIGLTQTGFNILMVLHRAPAPMTMSRLSTAVSVKPPNLSAVVRELVASGFVRRSGNSRDKRSMMVEIAPKGDRLLKPFLPGHFDFLSCLFDDVEGAARTDLILILDRLLASLSDDSGLRGLEPRIIRAASHKPSD